jgi:tetratricopeptide (TPR) repeat protein
MAESGISKEDITSITDNELKFPLATSLDMGAERLIFGLSDTRNQIELVIERAAQAARLWLENERIANAHNSLAHVWRYLPDLLKQPTKLIETIARLDFLKTNFEKLPREHEVGYLYMLGSAQAKVGVHTEAIANLNKAIDLAPNTKLAAGIWICHITIGNSYLALNQHVEGLKHLNLAWKGLEADNQPEKAAYLLGHLVKQTILIQSSTHGLEMLRKEKKRVSANPAETMVGLCEAVREIGEREGWARGYQLMHEIVHFLAEHADHKRVSHGWMICYAMINGRVSLDVVRDISGEITSIFPQNQKFAQRQARLITLVASHLEASPDERVPMMLSLDPDTARVVQGIVGKLAVEVRQKYKIAGKSLPHQQALPRHLG